MPTTRLLLTQNANPVSFFSPPPHKDKQTTKNTIVCQGVRLRENLTVQSSATAFRVRKPQPCIRFSQRHSANSQALQYKLSFLTSCAPRSEAQLTCPSEGSAFLMSCATHHRFNVLLTKAELGLAVQDKAPSVQQLGKRSAASLSTSATSFDFSQLMNTQH